MYGQNLERPDFSSESSVSGGRGNMIPTHRYSQIEKHSHKTSWNAREYVRMRFGGGDKYNTGHTIRSKTPDPSIRQPLHIKKKNNNNSNNNNNNKQISQSQTQTHTQSQSKSSQSSNTPRKKPPKIKIGLADIDTTNQHSRNRSHSHGTTHSGTVGRC